MPKDNVIALRCVICNKEYKPNEVEYVCPKHESLGNLDVIYNYETIRESFTKKKLSHNKDMSIWRYSDVLPIKIKSLIPPLRIGCTPLYRAKRLEKQVNSGPLWIKDDSLNPTGSYKDRASALGVLKALEKKKNDITCASSGNAAASLAGVAASVGLNAHIFVPEKAPRAKIAQMLIYGAHVMLVEGIYDAAYDLSIKASKQFGWYSRNSGYNPYLSEGKKTGVLEICEQLNWTPPDNIFVAVGDGCIIGGLWKGLKDLIALGFIKKTPKLFGVQSEGASPLFEAWRNGSEHISPIVRPNTLADSISVGKPRDPIKALRAVNESNGKFLTVSDEEILDSMRLLAKNTGVFGEPAAAAAFSGFLKLTRDDVLKQDDTSVIIVTGNGLKDVNAAIKASDKPYKIKPNIDKLKEHLQALKIVNLL
jgi:threonine synthase